MLCKPSNQRTDLSPVRTLRAQASVNVAFTVTFLNLSGASTTANKLDSAVTGGALSSELVRQGLQDLMGVTLVAPSSVHAPPPPSPPPSPPPPPSPSPPPTSLPLSLPPRAVDLGAAAGFTILAKSGVSTVPQSIITGDVGVSPIAQGALTGFSITLDPSGEFATSTQVTGKMYAADFGAPTPAKLTAAVLDMEAAYADAAGRLDPNFVELHAGILGGKTLKPGVYKYATGVGISNDCTLLGNATDRWIFQIAG